MRHILIYAYQLHYGKGSEYGLAWDHILEMSKTNRLTVLYGTSGGFHEMGNTVEMESYLDNNSIDNVRFIAVKPDFKFRNQDYGIAGTWFFYKQYRKYQKQVYNEAMRIYAEDPFDLVHYLGPIGYREPGYLWKLPCPFVWGPVGGMVSMDFKLLKFLPDFRTKFFFMLKSAINALQLNSLSVRRAFAVSDFVLACTKRTESVINSKYKVKKIVYLPQNCMKEALALNESKFISDTIDVAWIGNIQGGKALHLALGFMADLPDASKFRLHVVGDGECKEKCRKLAEEKGMEKFIVWHGKVSRKEAGDILDSCRLLLLTSLYDANPTVVWEAFSHCVPVVALETNGLEDFVNDKAGWLIPVSSPKEIRDRFISVFSAIADSPDMLLKKAEALKSYRENFGWRKRHLFFDTIYKEVLQQWNHQEKIK